MIVPENTDKYRAAVSIVDRLRKEGYEALFAGGVVRDIVMGKYTDGDIDIATNARPEKISRLFSHTIPVGAQFGVMIVVEKGFPFEVATFRSDRGIHDGRHPSDVVYTDARNDALRRDFTINGLFFDPQNGRILDFVEGRSDIAAKLVRAIGDPVFRFNEDYLRLLRAIRFAARFDFNIEDRTWNAITQQAGNITKISVERIFSELDKMLRSEHPDRAIELLDRSGLLAFVLPEVAALKGVCQPREFHPEGDVFSHTKKALSLMGPSPSSALAWSVLLHDIGKPDTITVSDRIRFNNHDQVGTMMARAILKRLHASNALIDDVCSCIANHMNFMQVRKMRLGTLKKFLSRPTMAIEMELHRIDCMASHGDCGNIEFLRKEMEKFRSETLKPPPLLRGKDLIELGFTPGPIFGKILSLIYELQLEEEISTRQEAIKIVMDRFGTETAGRKD